MREILYLSCQGEYLGDLCKSPWVFLISNQGGFFPKVLGSAASRSKQVPRGLRREIWALGGLDCKGRRLGGRRERERGSRWIDVREKRCIV